MHQMQFEQSGEQDAKLARVRGLREVSKEPVYQRVKQLTWLVVSRVRKQEAGGGDRREQRGDRGTQGGDEGMVKARG